MEIIAVDIDEVLCPSSGDKLFTDVEFCLGALKQHFNLEVVTARNPRRIAETAGWLAMRLPGVFSSVHFNRAYNGRNVTKADVCLDIGAKYLIDDLPEHCNIAAEAGIVPVLLNPKLSSEIHPDVIHVPDWPSALEYFSTEKSIKSIDLIG